MECVCVCSVWWWLTWAHVLAASCGQITGNLVKSKLKVAEQYVHILPMNTPVTVEGVKVILLDANQWVIRLTSSAAEWWSSTLERTRWFCGDMSQTFRQPHGNDLDYLFTGECDVVSQNNSGNSHSVCTFLLLNSGLIISAVLMASPYL